MNEDEEFEFRERAEKEGKGGAYKGTLLENVGQAIPKAAKDIFQKPAAFGKDLGTNPVTMAQAIPPAAGVASMFMPFPGASTAMMGGSRQISNAALRGLKRPDLIPSKTEQGLELGGAVLGDLAVMPMIKKGIFGKQIGKAENAANVITRGATKSVTPGSVGQTLTDLEAQLDSGVINNPQAAKDAKEVVAQIYKNPKIYEQTSGIEVQAARVSKKAEDVINKLIPGRKAPSDAMGRALTIPRGVSNAWHGIPRPLKLLAGVAGAGGAGEAGVLLMKKIFGE